MNLFIKIIYFIQKSELFNYIFINKKPFKKKKMKEKKKKKKKKKKKN